MKKLAFVVLGLLAGLAAFITAAWGVKGSWLGLALAAAFIYGAVSAFRKVSRLKPEPKLARTAKASAPRPWER